MAYDIGMRIKIDGEAEFRKSINGINDEYKTLKTEMASVTSAFDKNDQSQEKLTKQNEVLTKQIDLQKKKLQETQAVMEKATAEYGKGAKETLSWERAVNSTTAELNKLERQLKDNNNVMDTHEKKIDTLDRSTSRVSDGFGKLQVGIAAGVGALVGIGHAVGNVIEGMNDMEDQTAQMNAVLKSTGGVSGMTADELIGLADAFEDTTKFAAEQTLEAENLLLTFTNIGEEVFPQATETLLDMATAMGTDAKGGAIQLGKALNNPTEGISALTRVGVTFTDEQKNLIKALQDSGDMAGAQTIILQELQKEFGGSAKAAGETFSGKLAILNNSIGETAEGLLTSVMPALQGFVDSINTNMPTIQGFVSTIGEGFRVGAETFKVAFDGVKKKVDENAPQIQSSFNGMESSWDRFFQAVVEDNETLKGIDWEQGTADYLTKVQQGATKTAEILLDTGVIVYNVSDAIDKMMRLDFEGAALSFDKSQEAYGQLQVDIFGEGSESAKIYENAFGIGKKADEMLASGMETNRQLVTNASSSTAAAAKDPINKLPGEMHTTGTSGAMSLGDGIVLGTPWTLINAKNLHDGVKGANDPLTGEFGAIGSGSVTSMGAGMDLSAPIANAAAAGIYGTITGNLSPLGGFGTKTGEEVNAGLRSGMEDKPAIELSVGGIVNWVLDAFNIGFDIHSPAKKMHPIGVNVLQGLFTGMNSLDIGAFADSMVQRLLDAFNNGKVTALGIFNSMGEMGAALLEKMGISLGVTGGGLPVSGDITSYFGNRDDVPEYASKWHAGIDIGAASGTPIYAVESGTASLSTGSGYGNLVIIDNGAGLQEYYGHMSGFAIDDGQSVKKGDVIGYVGSTGNSTGPHLHFGVMQNGEWIDPLSLYGFDVGSRYIPYDMPAIVHQGEMIVPKSENPYANSGGSITGGLQPKQPAIINLVLQNGSKLAEYLIDDINNMLGVKTGLAGRGMA